MRAACSPGDTPHTTWGKLLIKIPIQLQVIHLFVVNNILRNGRPDLLSGAIFELLKGGA